jgi:hypothetical protein
MHSMFLPGQPLPALDDVQEGALYHVQLSDQSIATVQRRADTWNWRKLNAGSTLKGTRAELETWLKQEGGQQGGRVS